MKNILIALRALKNYRLYSTVNIIGLALSLACVITISRYLFSEMTVDSTHPNLRKVYCVMTKQPTDTKYRQNSCKNPNRVADFVDMSSDPAVLAKTTLLLCPKETATLDQHDFAVNIMTVDSSFTQIFGLRASVGSLDEVAHSVDKIALTVKTAHRIFGKSDPLGKVFTIKGKDYTVSAILEEPTSKTTLNFDLIAPTGNWNTWMQTGFEYFLMPANFDYHAFNEKYPKYIKTFSNMQSGYRYSIIPLDGMYFNESVERWSENMFATGQLNSLRVIAIVALIVLLIGIFNFVNIYTVLMLRRSREVGVKKVFGASIASVTGGIYLENLVMVLLAVSVGWIISAICREFAASVLGIPIVENLRFDLMLTAAFVVILPLLTTIYPYIKYSYAKPITSLRELGSGGRSIVSRATFLVLQYVMTIVMIIVSIYFVRQLSYMLNADLGYQHKNIISANLFADKESQISSSEDEWREKQDRRKELAARAKLLRDKLAQSPLIENFSYNESPHTIEAPTSADRNIRVAGSDASSAVGYSFIYTTNAFFSLYGIEKLQGRLWSDSTDIFAQYKCIVNEALLRELGIEDYTTAMIQTNERIWYSASNAEESKLMELNPPFAIVGVVRDFQIGHLRSKIPPLMILCEGQIPENVDPTRAALQVRAAPGKMAEAIALLGELHKEYGNGEFSYTIVDDQIAAQYAEDRKVTNIYTVFAIIAIFIGSLGLFSLSLYDVQQRYREIALRRVNGARVGQIVVMLLRKYYLLLGIAFVVAMPLAWVAIDWYMQDFATRAPLSWWIVVLAAAITAAISLLTLIYQTAKAARTNPAVAMKSE